MIYNHSVVSHQEGIAQEFWKSVKTNILICTEMEEILRMFSSYSKRIRLATWIHRFFLNIKVKTSQNYSDITVSEINHTKLIVLKIVQREFPKK